MGGIGGGPRWRRKETTSDYSRLDVRHWQRRGLLAVGRSFVHEVWNVEVITARKRDEPNMMCLYRANGVNAHREPYRVWIEWTPCNYGGKRPWLVCPRGCGHRVAILYYREGLACRHCRQLTYESRQESRKNRAIHGAQVIRRQLGGSNFFLDIPFYRTH
jgi:hypothetical protein